MLLPRLSDALNALCRYEQRAVSSPLAMIVMFAVVSLALCPMAIAVGFPPALAAGCSLVVLAAHAFAIMLSWCVESFQNLGRNGPATTKEA